jgi:S1-C subfamily serine protease
MSDTQPGQQSQGGAAGWPPQPYWGPSGSAATDPGASGPPTLPIGYRYPGEWAGGGAAGLGPRRTRRGRRMAIVAAVIIVGAAAGAGISHVLWSRAPASTAAQQGSTSPSTPGSPGSGVPGGQSPFGHGGSYSGQQPGSGGSSGSGSTGGTGPSDAGAIAAGVDPALVDVNSTFGYQEADGAGTGIVLTSTGEVLTNNHVVDGATAVSVTDVGNGKTYAATVVGYDSTHDVAVVQLRGASGLQTAKVDSAAATVGEPVVAIGNAGGTGGTPTSAGGSITALDQSISASDSLDGNSEQLSGLIEVNADIQSGDSGGSLVNSSGQVIGMDTAASSGFSFQSPGSSGTQGFAIPIDQALSIARQIESGDGSTVVHVGATAFLGVQVSAAAGQGTPGGYDGGGYDGGGYDGGYPGFGASTPGAVVSSVINGTAAWQAGLVSGDVITSLAGQTVGSSSALSKILVGYHPGDEVQLGWTDGYGQSQTATVDLGSGPPA